MDERWVAGRDAAEEPYRGAAGRTRFASFLLPASGGGMRPVNVPVAVDVRSDRHLAERLFAGRLHDVEGEPLAVPFVYHDPLARRFALVVPPSLRHRVLQERAELMRAIAEDADHPVPPYVARVPVVIGLDGLRAWLQGDAAALFEEVEPLLDGAEAAFAPGAVEEAAHRATTAVGEPAPEGASVVPEASLNGERYSDPGEPVDADDLQIVEDEQEMVSEPTRPRIDTSEAAGAVLGGADVEGWSAGTEDLEAMEAMEEAISGEVELVEEIAEADLVDLDGDLDEEEEVSRPRIALQRPSEVGTDDEATAVRSFEEVERDVHASRVPDSVPPPPEDFDARGGGGMYLQRRGDDLWLHVRREEGHEEAFGRSESVDLLVQLVEVEGAPVALLTLVDFGAERPYARRVALDPRSSDGRAVLEVLARRFGARVALYDEEGRYAEHFAVEAPREENVAWLLQRAGSMREAARVDASTAMERALAVPPPVRPAEAFVSSHVPDSFVQAWTWMERLAEQLSEDALRHAVLVASVPVPRVRATLAEALSAADRWGLVPEARLLEAVRRFDVGALDQERVGAWIQRLDRTEREAGSELEEPVRRVLWRRALDLAELWDVTVPRDVHERAWNLLHAREGDPRRLGDVEDLDEAQLDAMSVEQLGVLLEHPTLRVAAAAALCRRKDAALLPLVYRALRRMSRDDVLRVFPHVLRFGEDAADVLIDGLGARKTFVRQASAIGLGRLKLRRSVAPLVNLLLTEPSEVWREVARVLGELGSSALRSVARAARDPKGQGERLAFALAHLAVAGQREAVERLTEEASSGLAEVAAEALRVLPAVERHRALVAGDGEVPDDPVLTFGRKLEGALVGV